MDVMDIESVYNKYFKDVFKYTLGLCGNYALAEEITQETFFKALKNINAFDASQNILAWLFTISRNEYYSYLRKNSRLSSEEVTVQSYLKERSVIERLADEEEAMKIHHFLHSLKEPYKEVFTLRVFGELSFEKIGKIFNKSSQWARVTFFRARMKIKEYLEEMEDE